VTKLGQATDFGLGTPQSFYTHYPPLLTWIMAVWFKLVGIGDVQARLVPLLFTLGSLILLVKLFRLLKFKPGAILAGLAVALTPMWRYFSVMPSQEALIIFFSLASVVTLLSGKKKSFYASVILNGLSGWAGYFLYPWLWLVNKKRAWLIKAAILLLVVFLLHLLHVFILTGSITGGGLLDALLLRLNVAPPAEFSWWNYLVLEKQRLVAFYTLTLLGTAVVGTIWSKNKLILALLGWGLSYPIVFSNVVFVHDYFNIFFIPWLAVASAWLFNRLPRFSLPLALLFLLVVFGERQKFFQALVATKMYEPGFALGREINRTTPPEATVYVVGTKETIELLNLYTSYYADRKIFYLTPDQSLPDGAKYVFNLN
jgi:hypothetical protein